MHATPRLTRRTANGTAVVCAMLLGALTGCATPVSDGDGVFARHRVIVLDGDGHENVRSKLIVADVTGDGRPDWILKNGFRLIKAYDHDGAKLFERRNPDGFANGSPWHPFVDLAWDLDGDGRAEIIVTWHKPDGHYLQVLDGETGAVLREQKLWHGVMPEKNNQILMALAFPDGGPEAVILVEDGLATGRQSRGFDEVRAFDPATERAVDRKHAARWPLPVPLRPRSGRQHRRRLRRQARARCRRPAAVDDVGVGRRPRRFPASGGRHRPRARRLRGVAVGETGTRMYDVEDGALLWHIRTSAIPDPQSVAIGELDPDAAGLEIIVKERASEPGREAYLLDRRGRIRARASHGPAAYLNADLDGDRRVDEMIAPRGVRHRPVAHRDLGGRHGTKARRSLSPTEREAAPPRPLEPLPARPGRAGRQPRGMIVWGRHALVDRDAPRAARARHRCATIGRIRPGA